MPATLAMFIFELKMIQRKVACSQPHTITQQLFSSVNKALPFAGPLHCAPFFLKRKKKKKTLKTNSCFVPLIPT